MCTCGTNDANGPQCNSYTQKILDNINPEGIVGTIILVLVGFRSGIEKDSYAAGCQSKWMKGHIPEKGAFSQAQSTGAKFTNTGLKWVLLKSLVKTMPFKPEVKRVLSTLCDEFRKLPRSAFDLKKLRNIKGFLKGGFCTFSVSWELYKAYHRNDGDNPEIWQPLEYCAACANGTCNCGVGCGCKCRRQQRGTWSRIQEFLCSSTFWDVVFLLIDLCLVVSAMPAGCTLGGVLWASAVLLPKVWSVGNSIGQNFIY